MLSGALSFSQASLVITASAYADVQILHALRRFLGKLLEESQVRYIEFLNAHLLQSLYLSCHSSMSKHMAIKLLTELYVLQNLYS